MRRHRIVIAIGLAASMVLAIGTGAFVILNRRTLDFSIVDVNLDANAHPGMTVLRAVLILRNSGSTPVRLALITLFAYHPTKGTLFDTFANTNLQVEPSGMRAFIEVTNVTGEWSEVAFTLKAFLAGGPSWETALVPNETATWIS